MIKHFIFAAVVIFVVALLYTLSMEEYIPIPHNDDHIGLSDEKECLACHGEDSGTPFEQ